MHDLIVTPGARLRRAVLHVLILLVVLSLENGGALAQNVSLPRDDRTIAHLLNRVTFGPRQGDVEKVRKMGVSAFLDQQLHPERIEDGRVEARLASFKTLTLTSREIAEQYVRPFIEERRRVQQESARKGQTEPEMQPDARMQDPKLAEARRRQNEIVIELSEQKLARAVESERQLQEVLVDFWFNHFNVFAGKQQVRSMVTSYERDAIRPHVFGRFRDLLGATAHAPAMLVYLDNWQSADPNMAERVGRSGRRQTDAPPRRPRGLNENYARELLELHTLGVDGGYTQKDVQEVARVFTGWTIMRPEQGLDFRFDPRMHDPGDKVVLGQTIRSAGMREGEQVLDLLAAHPSTATFIATKLARRFVSDTPPAALVGRAADAFRRTGGDLREVVRTIVTSPEFVAAEAYGSKVKTPFEFVASALRASGAHVRSLRRLVQELRDMGMPLYGCQPPTGYADSAGAWVNTGALLNRMNFAVALVDGSLRGTTITQREVTALALGSPEFQRR